jgi:hypothetical protein
MVKLAAGYNKKTVTLESKVTVFIRKKRYLMANESGKNIIRGVSSSTSAPI